MSRLTATESLRAPASVMGDEVPIYHFNIHDGVSVPDDEGHDLPDITAARREAVNLAAHAIRDLDDAFWTGEEWTMQVTDHQGLTLFTMIFCAMDAPVLSGQPN